MAAKKNDSVLLVGLLGLGLYLISQRRPAVSGIGAISLNGCKYFTGAIETADELRKQFYKLSKKLHPDTGGNTQDFQQLQNEYETLKYRVFTDNNYSKEEVDIENELDGVMNAIHQSIMHLEGIVIEVVGKWLWISGNTFAVKNELKAAGLKFASAKKMWYFAGTKHQGKPIAMDDIRKKYGSTILKTSNRPALSGTPKDLVFLIEKLKFLLTKRKKGK